MDHRMLGMRIIWICVRPVLGRRGTMIDCPQCGSPSGVLDSRQQPDNTMHRRRQCNQCGHRWATREISHDEWKTIQAGRKRRSRAQRLNGKKSADARRGFKIPADRQAEYEFLRRSKGLTAREAAETLGIITTQEK